MTRLLVPIALDALVVRASGGTWAETRMKQPQKPPPDSPAGRQQLLPAPFTNLPGPRPTGAYLHWALADGLTRLQGWTGNFPPRFRPVPSRWMILRLSGNPSPKRQVAAWLLPNVHQPEPRVVSDILTRRDRIEVGPAPLPLTSAGHGDLGWSAYFDNVRNRLGFHDPLQGVTGPVAYLVCGWYTHTSFDPLAADQPLSEAAFRERLADLGWYADGPVPDPAPRQSLYHGSAVGIAWPGTTWTGDGGGALSAEAGGPPKPQDIGAALAETISAAVSRLVTTAGDPAELGLLVEGLAQQALGELSRPDGNERLLGALHASRFGDVPQPRRRETIYRPPELLADMAAPVAPAGNGTAATPGGVYDALASASPGALAQQDMATTGGDMTTEAGEFTVVDRTQPRLFHPVDPVLVVEGARRGYRHGGDGRFDSRDRLRCRYTGQTVTALGAPGQAPPRGSDVAPGWYAIDVPAEIHALFDELASLDPGSAPDRAAGSAPSPTAAARAAWWTTWDRSDPTSPPPDPPPYTIVGVPPSPVAVTPPSRPWTPLHLEWEADWRASPRGARDWRLGELDYEQPPGGAIPSGARTVRGRGMLTPAPASLLASAADRMADDLAAAGGGPLADELAGATTGTAGAGATLADSDLLSGSLQGFLDGVRGVPDGQVVEGTNGDPEPPYPVNPLRAGYLSVRRLRVVDTFGQAVDLLGSSATTPVDPARLKLHPDLAVPGRPELAAQVPRFTAPARVLLRFTDPLTGFDTRPGQSPVCGYVVPSPLDGTLEFFDAGGDNLGRLLADAGGTAWEEAPGHQATAGRLPSQLVAEPTLGRLGDGILAHDTSAAAAGAPAGQTALASLLRVIDTTQWTVDLTGKSGDEHLSLLLGNPVVVARARLLLEVDDELGGAELERTAVAVRLGSLHHSEDGLLGYFVGDDFSRVHVVDRAVAELALPLGGAGAAAAGADPLRGGYVDASGVLWVHPGHPVTLTLLVTPGSDVTVTTGLLPRKTIGLRREWTHEGLGALTPTLRYGPVLRDPKVTRLPVPADIHGNWTWHRRPDVARWASDSVVPATADALLAESPPVVTSGWLRLTLAPDITFTEHAVPVRVTCIDKPSATASIRAIGGTNRDGSQWRLPIDQAIELVESGRFRFFVLGGGKSADLEVDVSPAGRKYLRTAFDRVPENNLLALPRCEPT